ncbi:aspartate-semialdehyde dehydrogenase [Craterilacuibacter sp.]|uniref:aspartate-semialdehyde dehydrogenase n=1 Tax=Craterilacuibacter sp. TaxID=2870909 RepID=UPI003F2E990C
MQQSINVAVVGAKNLIGEAVLDLLAQRHFPASRVYAVDGEDYEGDVAAYGNRELEVHQLADFAFENVQLAIFVAGSDAARRYVPDARASGCIVIDFSAAFRADAGVPLLVSAINEGLLTDAGEAGLVSVPNCTVTPLAQALAVFTGQGLKRVTVSTYQSVSGAGQEAMEELATQTTALFAQRETEVNVFAKRIAFNVLPQIGDTDEAGDSAEERSVRDELRRVLALPALAVEATCVRVPVFFGHGWSVALEVQDALNRDEIALQLEQAGLQVVTESDSYGPYLTPMEATGNERIWVSRLRVEGTRVQFWLAADNVRAGAALNIVKLAEAMLGKGYFA